MNNPQKLSRLDILLGFFRAFRALLPLVIIFNINLAKVGLWWIAGVAVAILLSVWLAWLSWSKFTFMLTEDRLVINKGILKKEEKIIYYNRIHSVNIQQPLLYRLFKVAKLQIETPGGKKNQADGDLTLRINHAFELQKLLKELANATRAAKKHEAEQKEWNESAIGQSQQANLNDEGHIGQGFEQIDAQREQASPSIAQQLVNSEHMQDQQAMDHAAGMQQAHRVQPDEAQSNAYQSSTSGAYIEEEAPDFEYRLTPLQLLKASLTSLNLNIAFLFLLGIYSFSDDIIRVVAPNFEYWHLFERFKGPIIITVLAITIIAMFFIWLLSVVLYLIKYGDYRITRNKEQLSIVYGLLEKKSYIFDQKKIQAIILDENPLRQMLGYAELKVQVITSDQNKEQLVIHPYIRKKDLERVLAELLPDRKLLDTANLKKAPKEAWFSYYLFPTILATLLIGAGIWYWKLSGVWLLLLYPLVALWSHARLAAAGVYVEDKELVLRKRFVNRTTYFVARKHIVTLKVSHSPRQRRKELRTINVQVLGGLLPYNVVSLGKEHVQQVWDWYSRRKQ